MPQSHNTWVQSTDSNLDSTFRGYVISFPVLHFCWTPVSQSMQGLESVPAGKTISTISKRYKKTQQQTSRPQAQQDAVGISSQ